MTESEGSSYSEQAVSSLQPSIFLGSSSLYDLGDVDAIVPWDVLVADPSSDAETEACFNNAQTVNMWLQFISLVTKDESLSLHASSTHSHNYKFI